MHATAGMYVLKVKYGETLRRLVLDDDKKSYEALCVPCNPRVRRQRVTSTRARASPLPRITVGRDVHPPAAPPPPRRVLYGGACWRARVEFAQTCVQRPLAGGRL